MSTQTQTEALKLALEALEDIKDDCSGCEFEWSNDYPLQAKAHAAIKEALMSVPDGAQPEQESWLLETTQTLAKHMAREFYPEVTQWKCLDNLAGVISQIDNMTTGLMRKPEQEPVAWQVMVENEAMKEFSIKDMAHDWCVHQKLSGSSYTYWIRPLYTTPPQRKQLTRAVVWKLWCDAKFESAGFFWLVFARAIEAAHGIKEKNT